MRTGLKTAVWSLAGVVVFGLLLFLPAGTFAYWQAWAFIGAYVLASGGPTVFLVVKDPATIERRMKAGQESRPVQRVLVSLLFFLIPAVMVFCALDHRFGWSPVPAVVSLIGDLLVVAGLALSMAVVMQNRYAGGNIAVATGQKVISTGLYRVVRHPMYAGALIITIGTPLALDSWWGLASLIPTLAILVVRILDEEKALADELDGYREYLHRTRFRVVPYIW